MTDKPELVAEPTEDPTQVWPHVEPKDGAVYGFVDPAWGTHMVAMSAATWQRIMRDARTIKERCDALTAENIEFKQGRNPADSGGRIITLDKLPIKH